MEDEIIEHTIVLPEPISTHDEWDEWDDFGDHCCF
jgi:hypothetical protein